MVIHLAGILCLSRFLTNPSARWEDSSASWPQVLLNWGHWAQKGPLCSSGQNFCQWGCPQKEPLPPLWFATFPVLLTLFIMGNTPSTPLQNQAPWLPFKEPTQLHPRGCFRPKRLICYCNTAWLQYKLDNSSQWPENSTYDYNTL